MRIHSVENIGTIISLRIPDTDPSAGGGCAPA
jgi:hypothetical protein